MDGRADVTGVVLAGGMSRRFGSDKAWARLGERTLLEWVAGALEQVCTEVVVVHARGQRLPATCGRQLEDEYDARGPLAGLVTAFRAGTRELCAVAPVDAPLLSPGLVRLLIDRAAGFDAVVPSALGFRQPLVAVYRPAACLPRFAAALARREGRVLAAIEGLRVLELREEELRTADPALLSFRNANTPASLAALAALVTPGGTAEAGGQGHVQGVQGSG